MLIFAQENKSYFKGLGLGLGLGLDGDFIKSSLKNLHFSQCKKKKNRNVVISPT